jgi:hypothetical protein
LTFFFASDIRHPTLVIGHCPVYPGNPADLLLTFDWSLPFLYHFEQLVLP